MPADVVSVYDGDTMTVDAHPWPGMTIRVAVRLRGLNTPELRNAGCDAERALAARARALLIRLAGRRVLLGEIGHDKYGGRVDAIVRDAAGRDLAGPIIAAGLAEPYDGGKRRDWCAWLAIK